MLRPLMTRKEQGGKTWFQGFVPPTLYGTSYSIMRSPYFPQVSQAFLILTIKAETGPFAPLHASSCEGGLERSPSRVSVGYEVRPPVQILDGFPLVSRPSSTLMIHPQLISF